VPADPKKRPFLPRTTSELGFWAILPSEKSGQRPDSQVVKSGVLATSWVLWFSPRSGMGPPSAIRPIDSERERELTWVATLPS